MRLIDRLRYHRDALAALVSYGNADGQRGAQARAALDALRDVAPDEIARLRGEADELDEAGLPTRAAELRAEADELGDFLAGRPDPAPAPRRTRRGR